LESENGIDTIQHPYIEYKTSEVAHLEASELMQKVVDNGRLTINSPTVEESRDYAKSQLLKLNEEHKRFDNPHVYKVGISRRLFELKKHLIKNSK
jgi:nicotinate phosphoribosyltransferase